MMHSRHVAWRILIAICGPGLLTLNVLGSDMDYLSGNVWDAVLATNESFYLAAVLLGPIAAWYGSSATTSGLERVEAHTARRGWQVTLPWFMWSAAPGMLCHAVSLAAVMALAWPPTGEAFVPLDGGCLRRSR